MAMRTSKARRPTVVVVGSINLDLVVRTVRLPQAGETCAGRDFQTFPGGKGANQAVAAARLGAQSVMIGALGDDAFGRRLRAGLRKEGVNTHGVRTCPGSASGVAMIGVDDAGQNAITVAPGANHLLRPADLKALESTVAGASVVLIQLEIPLATATVAMAMARRHGVPVILDPAPMPDGGLPARLGCVTVLSPNQSEVMRLTGMSCQRPEEFQAAAVAAKECTGAEVVVLKLGDQGAYLWKGGRGRHYPAMRVRARDTTAAGDAFTAALGVRWAEGASLEEAVVFANAAGALAASRPGAQSSMPRRTEVDRWCRVRAEY
jgi:ribokinase